MEKLLRNRGLVEKGVGGFQIVFLEKSMFWLLLEYFFMSGKYSHLVSFLLENDILWNFFSSFSFKYNFVKILLLMSFISISISLKTSNSLENKSQVFERSDWTITVHNDLYYNELKIRTQHRSKMLSRIKKC